jgi:hypothetical protein
VSQLLMRRRVEFRSGNICRLHYGSFLVAKDLGHMLNFNVLLPAATCSPALQMESLSVLNMNFTEDPNPQFGWIRVHTDRRFVLPKPWSDLSSICPRYFLA